VGVSESLRRWALHAGVSPICAAVIPNGLDFNRLQNQSPIDIRTEFNLNYHQPVVVIVGGIRPPKGIENLLQAIELVTTLQEAQYIWIGNVQDKQYLDSTLASFPIATKCVRWVGARADAFALLAQADLAVLPSHSESGPLVLIEYMLTGLPFVAFQTGEVSQIAAAGGVPGFVPPNDVSGLAQGIQYLLEITSEARKTRGAQGKRFALENFDLQSRIPEWETIYRKILNLN
jgi:glycosyltransferase involved in cell wall biosynthesis